MWIRWQAILLVYFISKCTFSLSFLKDMFIGYRVLCWQCSFSNIKMWFYCSFLVLIIFDKKFIIWVTHVPLCNMFISGCFQCFLFIFGFSSLTMICLDVIFIHIFFCLVFAVISGSVYVSFTIFRNFSVFFLQIYIFFPFSLFSFWTEMTHVLYIS